MKLPLGKLPPEILRKHVLSMTGATSKDLVIPPGLGLDFAAVKIGRGFLIVSSDPITGVQRNIGWYAVNVSANDVATSGNRPRFVESVILFPEDASVAMIRNISGQIHQAAKRLGIAVVGGHTELTPGLRKPIVMITAFTFAERFVSARDAKDGDTIMMTKTAGIEGASILASFTDKLSRKVDQATINKAQGLIDRISVVDEAECAFGTGFVHGMHDCTEGGMLGGVYEMAYASKTGFEIFEAKVPVAKETEKICSVLSADPLKLIGSGALLLAVQPGKENAVRKSLRAVGSPVSVIGRFVKGKSVLFKRDGSEARVQSGVLDELWRLEQRSQFAA
ncbi:MAG: hypothetical protein HYU39_10870 [Thaumarchaeota archaeon]|nr:hypothetical protein [Nitrososphaerota archaeon]